MTDHAPFLQAIVSQPDADAPRLIYADWLEEQGQAERAEFIRVQCELAGMKAREVAAWDLPRLQELEDREQELLDLPAALGENPVRDVARHCRYRRGFIDEATLSLGMFLFQAERALKLVPLRRVMLTHLEQQHLPILAETPALERLQGMTLLHEANEIQVLDLRLLMTSPSLQGLESLTLQNILAPPSGQWANGMGGPLLKGLKLVRQRLDDWEMELYLRSMMCKRLQKLHIHVDSLSQRLFRSLVAMLESMGLEDLVLHCQPRSYEPMSSSEMEGLLASPALGNFRELRLAGAWLDDVAIAHLGFAETCRLTTLGLRSRGVNDISLRTLGRSEHLTGLRFLDLRGNSLEIVDIRTLANGPLLKQLKFVALDGRHLHRQALETLLNSRHWSGQTGLLLHHSPLTRQMLRDLRHKYRKQLPYCRVVQETDDE